MGMSIAPLLAEALAKPCAVIIFGGRVGHKPTGGSTHAARFETSMHLGKQQAPRRPPQKKRKAGLHGQSGLVKKSWQRATLPPPSEAVPSPQRVLTSVFGMGTGMTLALWSPGKKGCIRYKRISAISCTRALAPPRRNGAEPRK